ncbi:MAG TPA: hypothetical protein PKA62_19475, partial [Thermoanaerobaculia bacterium]|nr:hypothetical protein [Thermoanaerobaculia bacterium]
MEGGGVVEVVALERGSDRVEGGARGGDARRGEGSTRLSLEGGRPRQAAERPGMAFDEPKRRSRVARSEGQIGRAES